MTDTAPEPTEDYDAPERDGEAYPQYPDNPHNHRITVSFDPHKQPFVVVRVNTAEELKSAFAELETSGAYAAMGAAYDTLKRQGAIGAGAVSPAPQGPPAGPPPGTGPAYNPSMPPPQPAGSAPAAWQNAGAPPVPPIPAAPQGQWAPPPAAAPSEYTQHRWLRLDVPFPKKGEFEAICNQYQMRKGRPTEGGQYSFNKGDRAGVKGWHVAPDYAGAFPMFNPVPA